jgi:hypothetical protein
MISEIWKRGEAMTKELNTAGKLAMDHMDN